REVALALRGRQSLRSQISGRRADPELLIASEGEQPILAGGSAERESGLIAFQPVGLTGEEVGGIELRIANKPEHVAVNLVATRLGNDVHRAGGAVSLVRPHVAGLDRELLHRVREGKRDDGVEAIVNIL